MKRTKPTEHPFKAIRRAGVSLCAVETADPAATMRDIAKSLNGKSQDTIICTHDILNGLRGGNEPGQQYAAEVAPDGPIQSGNPAECLSLLAKTPPKGGIVFMLGAAREIQDGQGFNPAVCQGIWNLRDIFKACGATLVLISPVFTLPPDLARDVVTITEPLPDRKALDEIVNSICDDAGIPKPNDSDRQTALDTLTGLSAFEAEQTLALSVRKEGIDLKSLWDKKVQAIEATKGLTVYRGTEKLSYYAGGANAKARFSAILRGPLACTCIVFIDEVDKGMAAASSDSSGTTQDQSKVLLNYTQDNDILGVTAAGPPGTGKSFLMKCIAGEFNVPLIMMDLGAFKNSLVGQSEGNMRAAVAIIDAISDGRALWVIACNRDQGLPPEFRRRFSYLLTFFDLPDRAEKDAAWQLHTSALRFQDKTFKLRQDQIDRSGLNDDGWTPAEIRNCCLKAYAENCTLEEAAQSIVPISKSAAEMVTACRKNASGRYISANRPGLYTYSETHGPGTTPQTSGRKMETV